MGDMADMALDAWADDPWFRSSFNRTLTKEEMFPHIEASFEPVVSGQTPPVRAETAYHVLESLFDSSQHAIADSIRGFIRATSGKVLAGCDLSQIEARVLPWLAGEDHILANIDRIYELAAAEMFGVPPEETRDRLVGRTRPVSMRFCGKIGVLACGYGGTAPAFESMAEQYGVRGLDADIIERAVQGFRKGRKGTVKLWHKIERAAVNAVKYPGSVEILQLRPTLRVGMLKEPSEHFLKLYLPSGRILRFAFPKIGKSRVTGGDCLTYMSFVSKYKKWMRTETWGGKLTENIDSGIAFDIMNLGVMNLDRIGIPAILTIHDEVIVETEPERVPEVGPAFLLETEGARPEWMKDLPVKGETWSGERYAKA